ncbi:GatB/YqeY domain-containing protein [Patescibacteria group bacterium]|nr:GatB/YqeY domain-containing protein [Patescibacteria group bacterium]
MLINQIKSDLTASMLAKDAFKTDVLRFVISAIRNKAIENKLKEEEMSDSDVLSVLEKQVKSRSESIDMFKKGNRNDLVEREEAQLKIIKAYMPEKLSETETLKLVQEAVFATGATSLKDTGKIISFVKERTSNVDLGLVGKLAKDTLVS